MGALAQHTSTAGELDASRLQELEVELGKSLRALRAEYETVRAILRRIRDERLYRAADFDTFDDYCEQRWELSRRHVDRLIGWDEVAETAQAAGLPAPEVESHAREISDLEPEAQVEVWKEALETAPESGVTADHVKETRKRMLGDTRSNSRKALTSSESNEWYSDPHLVDAARDVFGGNIDLDPASNPIANEWIHAGTIYTAENDGLAHRWFGRFWLNPPNGKTDDHESSQGVWTARAILEVTTGDAEQGCVFVNSATGARWFQPLWKWPICFIEGRPRHIRPDGNAGDHPTHYRVVAYIGPEEQWDAFRERFSEFGHVHMPRR